ncbi:MAG: Uncharacterized protein XE11_1782 [Methanomicrobiales archaeon 53_19]|jgi:uncharacterized protein (UPF0332 family)|uniref:HEPN domain-containing protein n=1 Tax=Methanocalculus sp. TaxID=2004547 RepID=UPI000747169F|nr:HEPN domain-containing protein [Methanocalculus sp.]KUK67939.1 MAG: Uncharacterized protein XD88_2098 [Methanocalculus sp. 52_23]KUL02407.1 MAG: Uncharacterized protein XE11_1782 [Methanomicrobiales archaeon 53_19]HIJ05895.1 HEPN domain-containing protein [Methanocalculus sp.]
MKFEECIAKGLIRKDESAKGRVITSIESSRRFLNAAKKNLDIDELEMAEIAAYNSAFHSARSILFTMGYVERSHTCLITALKALSSNAELLSLLKTFDKLRLSRHNIQYGGSLTGLEEASYSVEFAEEFLIFIENSHQ